MSMVSVITTHIGQPLFISHTPIHTSLSQIHMRSHTHTHTFSFILLPPTYTRVFFLHIHSLSRLLSLPSTSFLCRSLSLSSRSLSFALAYTYTQTHTVILSLSHQGTLIKLGWSLMLSPRQQSPWRGWLFQKEKKPCAFYSHTTCTVPFAHTESDTQTCTSN